MKRPIHSLHGLGLTTTLCLVIVLSTLLANNAFEPSVAHAKSYIVDISLGKNPSTVRNRNIGQGQYS